MHGELLSIMLALEDVLETGDVLEAAAGQPLPIEDYENLHYLLGRRFRNKRKEVAPSGAMTSALPPPSSIIGISGGIGGVAPVESAGGGGAGGGGGENEDAEGKDTDAAQSNLEISQQARTETASKKRGGEILSIKFFPPFNLAIAEMKLSIVETPMEAYALIKKYIMLRKRVELMKREWGKRRLGLESIDTALTFKQFM